MNSDFMWDTDHAAAMRAAADFYQRDQKEHNMHKPGIHDSESASIIIAGVAACSLATRVLEVTWSDPEAPSTQVIVQLAKQVLDAWGLTITLATPLEKPPEPPQDTLVWPPVDLTGRPITKTLSGVYRENYYEVRETTTITDPANALQGFAVQPGVQLLLKSAYWNEEQLQWRMRISCPSRQDWGQFWLDHCKVRPGDEIPKVIDAAAQARSNDP